MLWETICCLPLPEKLFRLLCLRTDIQNRIKTASHSWRQKISRLAVEPATIASAIGVQSSQNRVTKVRLFRRQPNADLAQLVVQLTCNQQVAGSIPAVGTSLDFQGFVSVIHIQATSKRYRVAECSSHVWWWEVPSSYLVYFDEVAPRRNKGLSFVPIP